MDGKPAGCRADLVRVAALILFAAAVRFWLLAHTEVPARDSIDFMRCAVRLGERPWLEVVRTTHQAPGYPILILGVSRVVRLFTGELTCETLVLSAQLVSVLAGILTVVPMYCTGRRLFGQNAGFFAALLFQVFPVCVRVTSDGLSEGAFFLFVALALHAGVAAIQQQSFWRYFLCGLAGGMAYLTRPEGAEVVVAVGAVIVATGAFARSWLVMSKWFVALACGFAPFVASYCAATGSVTRKPAAVQLFQSEPQPVVAAGSGPAFAVFWDDSIHGGQSHALWSATSVLREANRASHNYGVILGFLGLWWHRDRLRREAVLWLVPIVAGIHALVVWRMAFAIGYVSERHTIMLAFASTFFAGALLAECVRRWLRVPALSAMLIGVLIAAGLPSTLKPLHANRAGHRAAGQWLARNAGGCDEIIDPFAWANFYAGSVLREGKVAPALPEKRVRFVVMEQSGNDHARLTTMPLARDWAARGQRVYHWPEHAAPGNAVVVVYRVDPGSRVGGGSR